MTAYEPGTVAVATVRGVEGVRVMRRADGTWWSGALVLDAGYYWHFDEQVTDVRPLAVIDPEDREQVERLTSIMRDAGWGGIDEEFTDGMRAALREYAAPTRERIPEPGIWGVVEVHAGGWPRVEWVRYPDGLWRSAVGVARPWDHFADPVLVRPGVGDE